jgi:hypothetical protein
MREKPLLVWHEDVICGIPHRWLCFQTGGGMAVFIFLKTSLLSALLLLYFVRLGVWSNIVAQPT